VIVQALIGCLSAVGLYTWHWLLTFEDRAIARGIAWASAESIDFDDLPIIPNHDHQGLV
jgi:hypothetical protein